ncbi:MAG: glycosyltransferase family 4 protein [Elusimicrobiota bacterium]|jgi:glycosyltransferase involved in cell wall biosynthesis
MKRVIMLSPNFHPHVGGAEKQALELSCALRRRGAHVRVLTRGRPDASARETVRGVEVLRLPVLRFGALDPLSFMAGAFFWLVKHRREYDAVHSHLAGSPALAAAAAARIFDKRCVIKIGGGRGIGEIAVSSRTLLGRVKLWFFRLLEPRFVCVAEELREELRAQGLGKDALFIPNGVDIRAYAPVCADSREALRRRLGLRGKVFLYMGRFSVEKRLPEFLESFAAAVRAAAADAAFVLVGSGPQESRVRKAVERLGLSGSVRFFPPTHDVVGFYQAADVFVLPSVSEGLSNALLESMACATAVLASRVGGTREAVSEGKEGLLFDPGSPEEERAKIGRFLREEDLAVRLGSAARRTAQERYSIEDTATKYLQLY